MAALKVLHKYPNQVLLFHQPQFSQQRYYFINMYLCVCSLSVGCVWVNSHSVSDPCMPVSGHKDSGTCTDGGQEVGFINCHMNESGCCLPKMKL